MAATVSKAGIKRIAEFRDTVTKVISLLAQRKINVSQIGTRASVERDKHGTPIRVNVPYIPDDATDEYLIAIRGFLDHEVAEILFTDPQHKPAAVMSERHPDFAKVDSLFKLLESTRIERAMNRRLPGCSVNLEALVKFVGDKSIRPTVKQAVASGDMNAAKSALLMPLIRSLAGQSRATEIMDDLDGWNIASDIVKMFEPYRDRIAKLDSTEQTTKLSQEIYAALKAPPPEPTPDESEEQPPEESPPEEEKKDEDKKGDGKSEKSEDADGQADESDETDGEGGGSEEDKEHDEDDEHKPDDADGDSSTDGDESDSEDGSEGESEGGEEGDESEGNDTGDAGEESGEDAEKGDSKSESGAGESSEDMGDSEPEDGEGEEGSESDGEGQGSESTGGSSGGEATGEASRKGDSDGGEDESDEFSDAGDVTDLSKDSGKEGKGKILTAEEIAEAEEGKASALDALANVDPDIAANEISKLSGAAAKNASYLPYTTDNDKISPVVINKSIEPLVDAEILKVETKLRAMIGQMQGQMRRLFAQQSVSVQYGGQRRGKLQTNALHRLTMGDDRVFSQKETHDSVDTVVTLLVDFSGSMSGTKMQTACQSAYVLSQTLDRLGIAHEIMGFTSGADSSAQLAKMSEEARKLGRAFSRWSPLQMYILKGFDERFTIKVKRAIIGAGGNAGNYYDSGSGGTFSSQVSMSENADGECVQIAGMRLRTRPEKRKILMVLSDGMPSCNTSADQAAHLKVVVKQMEDFGVETLGIGIMDSSVKKFYPKNIVINNISELPAMVMTQLSKFLIGKRAA